MSELLGFVPVLASLVLGLVYLWTTEGNGVVRLAGIGIFLTAVYLQFFSAQMVAGVLLQAALALTLEMWRRANT